MMIMNSVPRLGIMNENNLIKIVSSVLFSVIVRPEIEAAVCRRGQMKTHILAEWTAPCRNEIISRADAIRNDFKTTDAAASCNHGIFVSHADKRQHQTAPRG
jgi:hypothetical protein